MKFIVIVALAFITGAFAGPIESRGTAPVAIQDIRTITDMSNDLRATTNNITIFNGLLEGSKVPQGFQQIIQMANVAIGHMAAPPTEAFSPPDADDVVGVLTTFVQVHQALLNVVIGKHGILSLFFFTEPVRQILVALEGAIDAFAFSVIALIPSRAPDAMTQFDILGATLTKAIAVYS